MTERGVSRDDVIRILLHGERIEDYSDAHPFPSALFLGYVEGRPLHVVAAFNAARSKVAVVTTYEPDSTRFDDDFRTMKQP